MIAPLCDKSVLALVLCPAAAVYDITFSKVSLIRCLFLRSLLHLGVRTAQCVSFSARLSVAFSFISQILSPTAKSFKMSFLHFCCSSSGITKSASPEDFAWTEAVTHNVRA